MLRINHVPDNVSHVTVTTGKVNTLDRNRLVSTTTIKTAFAVRVDGNNGIDCITYGDRFDMKVLRNTGIVRQQVTEVDDIAIALDNAEILDGVITAQVIEVPGEDVILASQSRQGVAIHCDRVLRLSGQRGHRGRERLGKGCSRRFNRRRVEVDRNTALYRVTVPIGSNDARIEYDVVALVQLRKTETTDVERILGALVDSGNNNLVKATRPLQVRPIAGNTVIGTIACPMRWPNRNRGVAGFRERCLRAAGNIFERVEN